MGETIEEKLDLSMNLRLMSEQEVNNSKDKGKNRAR